MYASIVKANPYHDPKTGRFTTGPGGFDSANSKPSMWDITPKMEAAIASARDEVLSYQDGKEHGVVIDNTGTPVYAKDGDASSITFTDHEIGQFGQCVMVHNHPSGGSLSIQDVLFAGHAHLSAVEAVSEGGVYRAIPSGRLLDPTYHGYIAQVHSLANDVFEARIGMNVMLGVISPRDANLLHVDLVMESLSDLGLFKYEVKRESRHLKALRKFPDAEAREAMKGLFFETLARSIAAAPREIKDVFGNSNLFDEKIIPRSVYQ